MELGIDQGYQSREEEEKRNTAGWQWRIGMTRQLCQDSYVLHPMTIAWSSVIQSLMHVGCWNLCVSPFSGTGSHCPQQKCACHLLLPQNLLAQFFLPSCCEKSFYLLATRNSCCCSSMSRLRFFLLSWWQAKGSLWKKIHQGTKKETESRHSLHINHACSSKEWKKEKSTRSSCEGMNSPCAKQMV